MNERGVTMIELLVAVFILSGGVLATVNLFTGAKGATLVAQRHEVAVHQAQKEMEYLRSLSYQQLGLTGSPQSSNTLETEPSKFGYHNSSSSTEGSIFIVRSADGAVPATTEHLVLPDSNSDGVLSPDPTSFTISDSQISGKVYHYVTWRPENCGLDVAGVSICPGDRDTKRLIVAVTLDRNGPRGPIRPIWITSIAIDPQARPNE